jgi:N-acetylmuramic acid 6-phosphate etherase
MIKIGKTYENFMIDLLPTNEKLKDRAIRIVQELAGVNASTALKTLLECNWKVKEAVLILQCDLSQVEAQDALRKNCGVLRRALASLNKS